MDTHKNARLTPKGREDKVRTVVDGGQSYAATARKFNTTPKTVAKWVKRFRAEGWTVCATTPQDLFHRTAKLPRPHATPLRSCAASATPGSRSRPKLGSRRRPSAASA